MDRRLPWVQAAVLATGTAFSWITLVLDYRRFFAAGGHVLELSGCIVANPVVTPCFYGALAFLAALVWSVLVLRAGPKVEGRGVDVRSQRRLHWLLLAGTIFAWGNFGYLAWLYLRPVPKVSAFACPPGEAPINPLLAPCFYGALIFSAALGVSVAILSRARREA